MTHENTREISLDMVIKILEKKEFSHIVVREALSEITDRQDKKFITRVVMGTVEKAITLDYIIDAYSSVKTTKMKPLIRNLLRISVYQIFYMDSVPDSAVCNEAVKLAKKRKFVNLSRFINGVLRNISRSKQDFVFPDENRSYGMSIKYSCPEWIVKKIVKDYGMERCKRILEGDTEKSGITVRVNTSIESVEKTVELLQEQSINVSNALYYKNGLILHDVDNLENVMAFSKGMITAQDESSMLVGSVAAPQLNDYIVDVCAAPGGKSIHAADLLKGTGYVDSRDLTDYKVSLINENIERTGFKNIHAKVADAREKDEEICRKADIVIADVPCSGLGVLNKKADIKYSVTEQSLRELEHLQRKIITTVQDYVKPGGILIYSTCTINPAENIRNVNWIIQNYDFTLENIDPYIPESLQNDDTQKGYLQLLQGVHNCDGFFIARLRRGKN